VVESFPPTASNYNKAVECLKASFGRENLLVEFYVRVAQADNGHKLQGRKVHAFIPVRPDRNPADSAGDIRVGHRKVCGHVVPTNKIMPIGGGFRSVAT
jgi:hypothetical protein